MAYQIMNENTPRIRGVLFDMDGLVLDTEKLYSRFWMAACHFYSFPMTYSQSLGMRSLNSHLGQQQLVSYFGPTADYRKIRTKRIELMDAYIAENGVDLKPGIRELLDYLHAENILCGNWLERVSRLFSPFAFFFPGAACPEESHLAVREYAKTLRTAPQHPVFSMSLCDDVADVDEMITGKPRLLRVGTDGLIAPGNSIIRSADHPENRKISLNDLLNQYISPAPVV